MNGKTILFTLLISVWCSITCAQTSPWVDATPFVHLETAVAHIDKNEETLLISQPIDIGSPTLDIPENMTLQFLRGGSLILAGETVNILGSIEAGLWQIFDGDGTIVFRTGSRANLGVVYPQWWGAKGDGYNDDTEAIQAALNAVKLKGGGSISIPQGTYSISSSLYVDSRVNIFGCGWNSILKANDARFNVLILTSRATGSRFTGFQIQGAARSDTTRQFAIFTNEASPPTHVTVDHILISGPISRAKAGCNNGIKLDTGANDWTISNNQFEQLIGITDGHGYGVLLGAANRNIIHDNHFFGGKGQGRHAVYLSAGASYNIVACNIVKEFNEAAFPIATCAGQPPGKFNQIVNNTIIAGGKLTGDSGALEVYGNSSCNRIAGNTVVNFKGEGVIITDGKQGGLCTHNEVVGNSIYNPKRFGILVKGAKNTDIRFNKVFNASQSSKGTYSGIDVRSIGTFTRDDVLKSRADLRSKSTYIGDEVCDGSKIVGNTSWGPSQQAAFTINPTWPVPTNTVVVGNVFLAGDKAGRAYQLNDIGCTLVANASDQKQVSGKGSDNIDFHLSRSADLDFPPIPGGKTDEQTVSLSGVQAAGWAVTATPEGGLDDGLVWSAYVISSDTIAVRIANITAGVINPPARTFRVQAWKY